VTGLPLLVIDASAALALVLADEEGDDVAALVRDVIERNGQLQVRSIFWYEMGNGILTAVRRGRVDERAWQETSSLGGCAADSRHSTGTSSL
jgi:predicted nucleic acid-binding protein